MGHYVTYLTQEAHVGRLATEGTGKHVEVECLHGVAASNSRESYTSKYMKNAKLRRLTQDYSTSIPILSETKSSAGTAVLLLTCSSLDRECLQSIEEFSLNISFAQTLA